MPMNMTNMKFQQLQEVFAPLTPLIWPQDWRSYCSN